MDKQEFREGLQNKIADVVADVIIKHAPHTSLVNEQTKRFIKDQWLEGLESHTTGVISPLIDKMLEFDALDPEVKVILERTKDPKAQFGSVMQQFFIFGLAFSLGNQALQPFIQALSNAIWAANPDRPISPPDIATGVVRGIAPGDSAMVDVPDWAMNEANKSGVSNVNMQYLADITGMPPSPQELFQMVRRGIIDDNSLIQGLKEGDTRDDWISNFTKLRYVTPSPVDMVRAAVQNQLAYNDAEKFANQLGLEPENWIDGNPNWFKVLYDVAGRPPGPQMMAKMALRGIIPWYGVGSSETTFQQGVSESDLKDKWLDPLIKFSEYFPPVGNINTLLLHGGITSAQAQKYYEADGVPSALAEAYVKITEVQRITQDKLLAKGDVLNLLLERVIDDNTAKNLLADLGYEGQVAEYLIGLTNARFELEALRNSVRKIETLYSTYKISATEASDALKAVGIPDSQVVQLMATLETERHNQVAIPTPAQIADGLHYGVIDQGTAQNYLEQLGYHPWDAWFILSIRMHAKLENEPARPVSLTND